MKICEVEYIMNIWSYENMLTHALLLFLFFSYDFIEICFWIFFCFCFIRKKYYWSKLKEMRNSSKMRPLDFEKKWKLNSKKCFVKYQRTLMRLSPLCYFANLFTLKSCLILRGDQKMLSIWIFFCSHSSCMIVSDFYIIISCGIG